MTEHLHNLKGNKMDKEKTSWKALWSRTKELDNTEYKYTVYTKHYLGFTKYIYTSKPMSKWVILFRMKIHAIYIDWFIEPSRDFGVYFSMYKEKK